MGEDTDLTKLPEIINSLTLRKCFRRYVIHVVSPDGRPKYLGRLRSLLQLITPSTVILRYSGRNVDTLPELLRRFPKNSLVVLGSDNKLTGKLDELGIDYVVLGDG